MTALSLRDYQRLALEGIREHYGAGRKKVLLHLATGGGKTLIFCTILKSVHDKGNYAVMVVRGKNLVDQASQRLFREGVPHGVMQGSHWNYRPNEKIQVCSIDTLFRRKQAPRADIVVVDEAHFACSPSFKWLVDQYEGAFFLPVTATPHVKDGLRHVADEVVYPISIRDLIAQGYLVPPKYFAPPTGINFNNVRMDHKTGDYNNADLADAVGKAHINGDIVRHYRTHANNRPAILFAVNCEHSRQLAADLTNAGIPALHIEADTSMTEREESLNALKSGKIKVITNVGILCTGVDMPYVSAIIMARPTKSYNLFIQQVGRGTRLYENKSDFVVLDHADNIKAHGLIEYERECCLDGDEKIPPKPFIITCDICYHVWEPREQWQLKNPDLHLSGKTGRDYICQGVIFSTDGSTKICGNDMSPEQRSGASERPELIVDSSVKLEEIKSIEKAQEARLNTFYEQRMKRALRNGYKAGWVYYQIKNEFGEAHAKRLWDKIKKDLPQKSAR